MTSKPFFMLFKVASFDKIGNRTNVFDKRNLEFRYNECPMELRPLNENDWKTYLPFLQKVLEGRYLSSPLLYSKDTFFFRLSSSSYRRLVLSLNGDCPRIYPTNEPSEGHSLDSKTIDGLRKELSNVFLESISLLPNDRILKMVYTRINEVYKEETHILYAEMIPHHANLILTDTNGTILYVYRPSALESKRPLSKGLHYELPTHPFTKCPPSSFVLTDYLSACLKAETNLAETRKKEKYAPLFLTLKQKEKRLKRKIQKLEEDSLEASAHTEDGKKGDAIYTLWEEIKPKSSSFSYEGETIALDPSKTLAQNAEAYYRRAKKAKETLKQSQHFLAEAKEEMETFQTTLLSLPTADESALDALSKECLRPQKPNVASKTSKNASSILSSDALPYEIVVDGVRILFGKNARQNSFLSFLYDTAPNHLWFHILGRSGSHVMIKTERPSPALIRLAAEICLYESKKNDGDVMMCERKNVRAGKAPGEAIVKNYETIHLKNVSPETKRLCETATKIRSSH